MCAKISRREGAGNVEGKSRLDGGKKCWRCGFQISSGSICPICGAVNKMDINLPIGTAEPDKASRSTDSPSEGAKAKANANGSATTRSEFASQCGHTDNEFCVACHTSLKVDTSEDVGPHGPHGPHGPSPRPNLSRPSAKVSYSIDSNMQDIDAKDLNQRATKVRVGGMADMSCSYNDGIIFDETPYQHSAEED